MVGLYPLFYGFWLGMNKQTSVGQFRFIGFDNYINVVLDERFWKSITNTIYYTCGSLFIILPLAFLMAMLLNNKAIAKVKGAVSTVIFTPNVTSAIVVSIVFTFLMKSDGVINGLLKNLGLDPIKFLLDPKWAIPSVILLGTWKYVGVNSLFFLAGLQNIPAEIKEAAKIDCRTRFQELIHITLPMLKPIMTFIVFQAIVGSFNIFGEPFLLAKSGAGPNDSFLFPTVYLYLSGFRLSNVSYASAIGYVLTIIIFIVTLLQMNLFQRKDARENKSSKMRKEVE